MNMVFSLFFIVYELYVIVCICFMFKGVIYKIKYYLMKNVGMKNVIFIVSILLLCLICFNKRNGE